MALIIFGVSLVSVFMAEMNVQSGRSDLPDFVNPPPIQRLLQKTSVYASLAKSLFTE